MNFPRSKLFENAFKMDKDKKTVGSLSSGDYESKKEERSRSRDVVINNFSTKIRQRCLGYDWPSLFLLY